MPEPAAALPEARPRVLLLAMYRLDHQASGPTVRISAVRDALASRVALDLVSGARWGRSWALARYLLAGRLRGLAGIYVESSTSLPGPADFLFLGLARARRIPVLTYVRDAYQLFPEYYPADTFKRRLGRLAFRPVLGALLRVSTTAAFPSRGLARAVLGPARADAAALLPPGARVSNAPPVNPAARAALYVGSLAHEASGRAILLDGMRLARERGHELELICVTPPGERRPRSPAAEGTVRWVDASGAGIEALLPEVLFTITPRRRSAYNDLALPIKVMEYLGYGRPLLVTAATETAAIVQAAGCGLVVPDTADGLAEGIAAMATAAPEQVRAWGAAARTAAEANTWDQRAKRILDLLGVAR